MAASDVEYRCFVGGLAWATDDRSIESPFDEIIESKVVNDRETGSSRGFGFVTLAIEKSMSDAIEGMNEQSLDGGNITVNGVQSKGSGRGRGGGGFCVGSYSGCGGGYGGGGQGGGGYRGGYGGHNSGYGSGGGYYRRGGVSSGGSWRN